MAGDLAALRRDVDQLQQAVRRLTDTVNHQHDQIILLGNDLGVVEARTQRVGANLSSIVVGSIDVTITWPTPWNDTVYTVMPTILSGTAALGALYATLKAGSSKTETSCVITVANTGLVTIVSAALDVVGIRT
jgi:hypothetical protein